MSDGNAALETTTKTDVSFPGIENRTCIIGSTGSGKTVFGAWLLSTRKNLDWRNMPVVMFDWKGDKLLGSLGAKEISVRDKPPKKPGLYMLRLDDTDLPDVDVFLNRCWAQENIGLFFDEAAELEKSRSVNRVFKQGRSKHIPIISCTQRPVWLPRSVFSESEYFAIFRLNDRDDQTTVKRFVNADVYAKRLPHHCLWYDVVGDAATVFKPVPSPAAIREAFADLKTGGLKKRVI